MMRSVLFATIFSIFPNLLLGENTPITSLNNFGLPGIISLPNAKPLPDGEIIISQQVHESLAQTSLAFQAFENVGFTFRYSGHGKDGNLAGGRILHDRSFDVHVNVLREGKYHPGIAVGLRDFIGTGWDSSEYIVATKSIGALQLTTGLGFGGLAGVKPFENPLKLLNPAFTVREANTVGTGGTLGTINWFQGSASIFGGIQYKLGEKLNVGFEYTSESSDFKRTYMKQESQINYGLNYTFNDYFTASIQYLHGSTLSLTAMVNINPKRPPHLAGRDNAPVPMRARQNASGEINVSDFEIIRNVFAVEGINLLQIRAYDDYVRVDIKSNKYRSVAQSLGRVIATLQRFTPNEIKTAIIVFQKDGLELSHYKVNLERIAEEQFGIDIGKHNLIEAIDTNSLSLETFDHEKFHWGVGPYVTHRLFNPFLPLSAEIGAEVSARYSILQGLKMVGKVRKSIVTNLDQNPLPSGYASSNIPTVQSDWGMYDMEGQSGHIHSLKLVFTDNISSNIFLHSHIGLLEPGWSGYGAEVLFSPNNFDFSFGIDVHEVQRRDYPMLFTLRDYRTTTGHVTAYYDAGENFDIEINYGKYLAGDWGSSLRVTRKFANGWEVGGYATLTDVPFQAFGEGSFDKGIFVKIPMDWLMGDPVTGRRHFEIRPITKDGGAILASGRQLYRQTQAMRDTQLRREYGRLWK